MRWHKESFENGRYPSSDEKFIGIDIYYSC